MLLQQYSRSAAAAGAAERKKAAQEPNLEGLFTFAFLSSAIGCFHTALEIAPHLQRTSAA